MTTFERQVIDKLVNDHKVPAADAARAVAHAKQFTDPTSVDFAKGVDHVVSKIIDKGGLTPLNPNQVALESSLNKLTGTPTAQVGRSHPDADDRRVTTKPED